jgi:serine/threonine protein kinase
MEQRISPSRSVCGSVVLPGDKSISHRYAMIAAVAEGATRIANYATGADCHSTLACVRALGIDVEEKGTEVVVHGKGLVHGSVRPSNVMVASGVLKVADLGLGRLAHAAPADPDYAAPENRLDVAADLYALAAMLYHVVTGVHPRTQPQGAALPLPSTFTPGVPEALDKLLLRALHPRPELRLRSADEMAQELKGMVRLA